MNKFMFIIVLPASFGVLLASLGYGILTRPDVFLPACIIFSFICVWIGDKND